MKCAFRRIHTTGIVARFEIGFRLDAGAACAESAVDGVALLRGVLGLSVRVRTAHRAHQSTDLLGAGELLARHFVRATTGHRSGSVKDPEPWWFSGGFPAVVIEHDRSLVFPPHARHVWDVEDGKASLSHMWFEFGRHLCSVWFLSRGLADVETMRRLRIHLLRLHAERECLRSVIGHLKDRGKLDLTRNTLHVEVLQKYLNESIRLLRKPTRFGVNQRSILDAARHAVDIGFEGETASLRFLRKQVAAKVASYVRDTRGTENVNKQFQGGQMNTTIQMGNVTVSGELNVTAAANIRSSLNKAPDVGSSKNLRERLQTLTAAISQLTDRLPEESAKRVTSDLEILTSESTSSYPNRERCEQSAKGIVAAVTAISGMTASVCAAVGDVIALLSR